MNPELIMETRNSLLRIMAYLHQARHEVVRSTCSASSSYSNSLLDWGYHLPPVVYLCHVYYYCPLSVLRSYLLCPGGWMVTSFSCAHIVHLARPRRFTIKIHTQQTNATWCRYLVLESEFMPHTRGGLDAIKICVWIIAECREASASSNRSWYLQTFVRLSNRDS